MLHINVGTGGQISWLTDRFRRVEGMDTRYLPRERYLLVGAGLSGGDAYAWVQRTASAWLRTLGVELPEEEIYRRLENAIGASSSDAEGLVCEPFFRGTRQEPDRRGRFLSVTADNFTPGNVARAVLRGIVDAMASFRNAAGVHAPAHPEQIVATGNAIRRNPRLVELLADRFGLPVNLAPYEEEAAYGAARLAAQEAKRS